ncbi:MAG: hypothetical protein K6E53_00765 [Lachnospiraceae bacterium]|nr:hypothetical protein [Lachnospiraceae bacterium]
MSFLSVKFIILITFLLISLHFIRNKTTERMILLASSYLFYGSFDLTMLAVLICLSVFTWIGGYMLNKAQKDGRPKTARIICLSCIAGQTFILMFFKFAGLFPMPVGLSFYMLQAISFLADNYRGELSEFPSLIDTLVYIGFFPQIVSGPIVKAKDFIPQLNSRKKLDTARLSYGIQLFALGAFMKLVMADRLAVSVDSVYSAPLAYSGLSLFFASVGYSLQLMFDFAGYSNMAIGVAWLLGYDLGRNFNLPYLSSDPSDFWKRWHISLSTWLRDYVYIPLGGSRKGKIRTYINIFLTMLVSGLWHGSTLNFLIWGAVHGLWQVIHRVLRDVRPSSSKKTIGTGRKYISVILSFLMVNFLWIPFRTETLSDTITVISRIITMQPGISYFYVYTFIFGAILLISQLIAVHLNNGNDPFKPLPLNRMYGKVLFCCFLIAIAMFAYFGNGAFIYAKF